MLEINTVGDAIKALQEYPEDMPFGIVSIEKLPPDQATAHGVVEALHNYDIECLSTEEEKVRLTPDGPIEDMLTLVIKEHIYTFDDLSDEEQEEIRAEHPELFESDE